ncbi:hypothetical protein L208DRAFT_1536292, partial [Tricholoma matsutake]
MGWKAHHLDQLSFPPMASEDAFGFVDPSDVLQSCHVIPQFAKGKWHSDGVALSKCARDGEDWKEYYVGCRFNMTDKDTDFGAISFVDRDMMMRYHWGQGIRHTYCHDSNPVAHDSLPQIEQPEDDEADG